jgi:hypothetical protein
MAENPYYSSSLWLFRCLDAGGGGCIGPAGREGVFVMRLKFPANYRIAAMPPHEAPNVVRMAPRVKALAAAVERATEHLLRCSARYERSQTHQARVDVRNAERELASLKDALKFEMARATTQAGK